MSEKFNPSNPEYKKVEDLPEEKQDHFRNHGNGFVGKRAYKEHELSTSMKGYVESLEYGKQLSAAKLQELIDKNASITGVEGEMEFLLEENVYQTGSNYSLYDKNGVWVADLNARLDGSVCYGYLSSEEPDRYNYESDEAYRLDMEMHCEEENGIFEREKFYTERVENFLDTVRKNADKFSLEVCLVARVELDQKYPTAYVYSIGSHEIPFSVARNYTSDGHGTPIKAYGYEIITDSQFTDVDGNPVHAYDKRPVTDSQLVEKSNQEYGRHPYEKTLVVEKIDYVWKGGTYLVVDYIKLGDNASHVYVRSYDDMSRANEF